MHSIHYKEEGINLGKANIDLAVVLFRDELYTLINKNPLPITVKSMIVERISEQIKKEEEETINNLLNSGGDDINVYDNGRGEQDTLRTEDENLLTGQQSISAGTK